MRRLDDRVALITGGAGAIGRATARRLLADGAKVAIADRSEAALERVARDLADGPSDRLTTHVVDVTSDASVRDLADAVVAVHGRIDVLFTCAGVLAAGSVTETSLEDWDRTIATNLTGPFLASRHVVPVMLANGGGAIVHMASTAGVVAEGGIAAYCASKGGVVMLARQMAVDYARSGIRVNVVCPGWIDTPFNDPAIDRAGGRDALAPFIDVMVPMGRQGAPDEVADVVAFLVSDDARLMTGAVVVIDGGLTAQ
ncbi:MAG TPA: SDR family NAD(P)-dependent oxidoreductase [Candidatus Limnocylindrales bacterium]|nr:SDR family NAD(P)-dependent oxidoreductase [Candidatus Limnocylindrales bacterium]